jgi:hypothetical protein
VNALCLVNTLLENGVDDEIDTMSYALGTKDKDLWTVPHPWVAVLRPLGYKMSENHYDDEGHPVQYYAMEKDVKLASGEKMELTVSGYTQPDLQDKVGVGIAYEEYPGRGRGSSGVFGSRPIGLAELKRVIRDIERRLARTQLEYSWNDSVSSLRTTLQKVLRPYEYWHHEKRTTR